jgi:hypothetical protein
MRLSLWDDEKRYKKTPSFTNVSHCTTHSPTRIDRTASGDIRLWVRPKGMTLALVYESSSSLH